MQSGILLFHSSLFRQQHTTGVAILEASTKLFDFPLCRCIWLFEARPNENNIPVELSVSCHIIIDNMSAMSI